MDQGTAALWAATVGAASSLVALRANAKSTSRQLEGQRAQAKEDAREASLRLSEQATRSEREASEQRKHYEKQIQDVIAMVRADLRARHFDQEKFEAYRSFALWFYGVYSGWLYRDGEWTDELHAAALTGPPPETLAVLAILAPEMVADLEEMRRRLVRHSAQEVRSDPRLRDDLLYARHEVQALLSSLAEDLQSDS